MSLAPAGLSLLLLAACGSASSPGAVPRDPLDGLPTASTGRHAPPALPTAATPPVLQRWTIGQWATYTRTTRGRTEAVRLRVVAEDGCGFWIDVEVDDGTERRTARACVRQGSAGAPDEVRAIAQRAGDELMSVSDGSDSEAARSLQRVLQASWTGAKTMPREDVITPAGTFLHALREVADARTRWSHPAVPITGLVREREGIDEMVLVEYGTAPAASVILPDLRALREQTVAERPRRRWFGITLGTDAVGNLDDATWTSALGISLGWRMQRELALLFQFVTAQAVPYPVRPELSEKFGHASLGLRWYPFDRAALPGGRGFIDVSGAYAQLDLGYAQLERDTVTMGDRVVGRGGVAGVRVGLLARGGRDWNLGIELHEHTGLFNSDEGIRIAVGVNAVFELLLR